MLLVLLFSLRLFNLTVARETSTQIADSKPLEDWGVSDFQINSVSRANGVNKAVWRNSGATGVPMEMK